ncbi:winged helix-turn-helix transcriptional regulator [Paenibacillus silvae]|uniref:winged helix-turn-helix transcriptional regulator n=1 Tax=Paenibacillus silvae TaxID=1325358 RepID=UPI0011A61658|nr:MULTISPECIES: response regulator transcription factor [Paenibacillus]MCK6076831.1 response regulator transcription factor [Paenibacillus silvae]MCK6152273.1 response regulator transcription factor [Paenibacillus silvae]MCK6269662.1 response regulator transcription factor [Paenibacillus silvae]
MKSAIMLAGAGETAQRIEHILQEEGYEVRQLDWSELEKPQEPDAAREQLIILVDRDTADLQRSEQDRMTLKKWMNQGNVLPILVIIPEASPQQVIDWLDFGANDVMEEPLHPKVMLAKIRSLLRLFATSSYDGEEIIVVQDLKINLRSRRVSRAGQYLNLTPKEYELLEYLATHLNEACTRSDILREVWGYDFAMDTNVVDVYIKHLRGKVDKGRDAKLIQTVRGVGYMLYG